MRFTKNGELPSPLMPMIDECAAAENAMEAARQGKKKGW